MPARRGSRCAQPGCRRWPEDGRRYCLDCELDRASKITDAVKRAKLETALARVWAARIGVELDSPNRGQLHGEVHVEEYLSLDPDARRTRRYTDSSREYAGDRYPPMSVLNPSVAFDTFDGDTSGGAGRPDPGRRTHPIDAAPLNVAPVQAVLPLRPEIDKEDRCQNPNGEGCPTAATRRNKTLCDRCDRYARRHHGELPSAILNDRIWSLYRP